MRAVHHVGPQRQARCLLSAPAVCVAREWHSRLHEWVWLDDSGVANGGVEQFVAALVRKFRLSGAEVQARTLATRDDEPRFALMCGPDC